MKLKKRMMTGMLAATLGAMTPVLAQTTEPSPYSSYLFAFYNPQIEMFARFKMKSSFHKTKRII